MRRKTTNLLVLSTIFACERRQKQKVSHKSRNAIKKRTLNNNKSNAEGKTVEQRDKRTIKTFPFALLHPIFPWTKTFSFFFIKKGFITFIIFVGAVAFLEEGKKEEKKLCNYD